MAILVCIVPNLPTRGGTTTYHVAAPGDVGVGDDDGAEDVPMRAATPLLVEGVG